MMVQENVYKMAIMTLSSKLYLQWTTFVSIKKSPVPQLPFLGNCRGHKRERLSWGSGGRRSTAGCCFLAEILLSIHRGHKQAAHEHAPQFWGLFLPSRRQVSFLQSPRRGASAGSPPWGQTASSCNPDLSISEPWSFLYSLHHGGSQKERGRK